MGKPRRSFTREFKIEAVKLEGKSVAETAARYGMSESNVKISIHRGLKALASFIGRDQDE